MHVRQEGSVEATPVGWRRFWDAACGGRRFRSDWSANEEGSTAIVFALSTIVLISVVGGAVDLGRAFTARERTQSAVDSAVLAAARVWQTENDIDLAEAKGLEHFLANRPDGISVAAGAFVTDTVKNTITLTATVTSPAPFLGIVGHGKIVVQLEGQAQLAKGVTANRSLEISMMLDTTGSMSGTKLDDLKVAAKDLIDIAIWDDQGQYKSRIALVPFSEAVRPGPAYLTAVRGNRPPSIQVNDKNGNTRTYKLTDCVSDRQGTAALTDDAPAGSHKVAPVYTRSGSCSSASQVVPLTSNKLALKASIDAFVASGSTAGQVGTEWAWFMLSPLWNGIWPAASQPGPYEDQSVLKVAVLMTDGEYNRAYDANGISTDETGQPAANGSPATHARAVCTAMKAKGITVFAIGFQLQPGESEETLRQCATDSSYFYNAENGEVLRLAFRDIAQRLATFHLSQ